MDIGANDLFYKRLSIPYANDAGNANSVAGVPDCMGGHCQAGLIVC